LQKKDAIQAAAESKPNSFQTAVEWPLVTEKIGKPNVTPTCVRKIPE